MTLTKKSSSIEKKEDSSPVLEGELIYEESEDRQQPVKIQENDKPSLAFIMGKIVGTAGAFLFGLFQNRNLDTLTKKRRGAGKGRRLRAKKRINRRKS
jgi:hypothetical protein